jgi:tetratricopeptide (TPR) repeat protein
MTEEALRFVMAPWGAEGAGEDVWLLENALVFGLENIFEQTLPDRHVHFADLYDQLGGELKRTSIVTPYTENEIRTLASKTPAGTDAIVDGLLTPTRDRTSGRITSLEIAPRLYLIGSRTFTIPDAFIFSAFDDADDDSFKINVSDFDHWNALVIHVAESLMEPFRWTVPSSIGPENLRVTHSWQAYCSFLKGKRGAKTTEEKTGYYRQASRIDPDFYWARFNCGQLYKGQEDYHSARREFLGAIKGANGNPALLGDVYFELGLCSIFLGDPKTARNFWDEALSYAPSNPTLLINIAGTYEQEEDWSKAIALHQQALDIDPTSYKALVNVARLKAQLGDIPAAIPLYERALDVHPNDPLRHAILGGCYLSLGDEEKARGYFNMASHLDPTGSAKQMRIDEADAPPSPGEYARQELTKMDEELAKRNRQQTREQKGWKWFGR